MFTNHTAKLPGGPISYRKGGSGRPLLYIHGTGGPNHTPVTEMLAQNHALYLPTYPGWDGTAAHPAMKTVPDIADVHADFIRDVIGGPCDVIGNSFGGWVAQWLAVRHPDVVDQLVLQVSAGMRDPGTGGLPTDPVELRRQLYKHPERAPQQPQRPPEVYQRNRALRDTIAAGVSFDNELYTRLPEIKARTLIIFGLDDEISPHDKAADRLRKQIKQAHLTYIYDAAHAIEFDQPGRVARLVLAFLERGEGFLVRSAGVAA